MAKTINVVTDAGTMSMEVVISGDVGGNAQENEITFDGEQFILKDVVLRFYGAQELDAFFELVRKADDVRKLKRLSE